MSRISWSLPVAAVLALAAVTGCQPEAPEQGASVSSSPSRSSAKATPTPTPTPALTAADGTDVSACSDVECEILVRPGTAIPVPKSSGVGDLKVTKVTADRVTLTGRVIGDSSFGGCYAGNCDVDSDHGAVTIVLGDDSLGTENGVGIRVHDISGGAAIIELEPVG
ncbi:hypothetical protein [Flindersiella endophytica]